MAKRTAPLCLIAAVAVALPSCGGSTSDEDRVESAIVELQREMTAGRVAGVCAGLTDRPKRQIGSVGHGRKPTTCERDLRELLASTETSTGFDEVPSLRRARRPKVVGVELDPSGNRAVATLSLGGNRYPVPLAKQDGSWKVDDFFGAVAPAPKELR